jgi:hypothetical protein
MKGALVRLFRSKSPSHRTNNLWEKLKASSIPLAEGLPEISPSSVSFLNSACTWYTSRLSTTCSILLKKNEDFTLCFKVHLL